MKFQAEFISEHKFQAFVIKLLFKLRFELHSQLLKLLCIISYLLLLLKLKLVCYYHYCPKLVNY